MSKRTREKMYTIQLLKMIKDFVICYSLSLSHSDDCHPPIPFKIILIII